MQTEIYTLPEWDFVGGETQRRGFTLLRSTGAEYDLPSAQAELAVVDFMNPSSAACIVQQVPVQLNRDGVSCEVSFTLSPADTVDLAGKYMYQITVRDVNGNTSIPRRGKMYIIENLDKTFVL